MSTYWWLGSWAYVKFILRELSCIFVAYFVVVLLATINSLRQGPQAYAAFQSWLGHPFVIALNCVCLFFVVFHAVTFFNLAPRAMVVRLGGKRLPDFFITAPNYVAWLAVSAVLAWLLVGR